MTRSVSASLAARLDDIVTGRPVWPADRSLRVEGGPVAKDDGYFVFTGERPDFLRVTSSVYHGFAFPVPQTAFLRISMVPKYPPEGRLHALDASRGAYVGFGGARAGYALASALEADDCEISLHKEDFADLVGLRHILTAPDGTEGEIYIRAGLGRGRYVLDRPAGRAFPPRTRMLPLYFVFGGRFQIPVPEGAQLIHREV